MSDSPSTVIFVACISIGCFAPSVDTNLPSTNIDELIGNLPISLKFSNFSSTIICMFLKNDPSFNSINPKFFDNLDVLIQPATFTSLSIYSSLFL